MGCLINFTRITLALFLSAALLLGLTSCSVNDSTHGVIESYWHKGELHRVSRGETLYSIAFNHDMDYIQLARINHLKKPYILFVGQIIHLKPFTIKQTNRRSINSKKSHWNDERHYSLRHGSWDWPFNGRIVTFFSPSLGNKGINLAGKKGQLIRAASNGVVAYAGSGLSGYGNLIIIQHSGQYMTAYGNNSVNRVHEGQVVKAGQVIGVIGVVDNHYWGLHFEVRKSGRPVNPLFMLRKRGYY